MSNRIMHHYSKDVCLFAACLSALAGFVDVVGFLQLGGYFISFMSGNSTKLAVNLMHHDLMAVVLLAVILGLFVIGAIIGVLVRHLAPKPCAAQAVLAFVAALLAAAALA